MTSTPLNDAIDIWQAGVDAVRPDKLFAAKVVLDGTHLVIDDNALDLSRLRRLIVVGAGKASAAMAIAFHHRILSRLPSRLKQLQISGWINCPEGTASETIPNIVLHQARPAGLNVPTAAAVHGTERIMQLVSDAGPKDAVLCLLSGGGSALLVAPIDGLHLEDKQHVAAVIAAAGGNIEQLNLVRRATSRVKGGGLARMCRAGRLVTCIISDVLGDSLATIASGPTWLHGAADPCEALQVLQDLGVVSDPRLTRTVQALLHRSQVIRAEQTAQSLCPQVDHIILGNNVDAVDAAGVRAVELGYRYVMQAARQAEGDVSEVIAAATAAVEQLAGQREIDCWISSGEPTVSLPQDCGRGGRNQQLALGVLQQLLQRGWPGHQDSLELAFVSGGTDGEDGPTDAAGAGFDQVLARRVGELSLDPEAYLKRADAYTFFEQTDGLVITGPTGTNVCDLRVAVVRRSSQTQL